MRIDIDDALSGEERRAQIIIQQFKYAIKKFDGDKSAVARFLGLSRRAICNYMRKYEDLSIYLTLPKKRPDEYYEMKRRYPDE